MLAIHVFWGIFKQEYLIPPNIVALRIVEGIFGIRPHRAISGICGTIVHVNDFAMGK